MARSAGQRWTKLAVCTWIMLLVGLAVFSYRYPWSHTVYDIYARACRHWWSGEDLYRSLGTNYYRYSPLFAISMTGWALLPDTWGGALWRIFNGLFYAAALQAWASRGLPGVCSRTQRAALLLLVLPLSAQSMHNGQANVVMVAALLLGITAASAEHWNRAAAWLALAALIKGYPLALGLLVSALSPRRFLPRYVIALALGLLLPFATQSPDIVIEQYRSWLAHLHDSTVLMRERLRTVEYLFSIYGYPASPRTFLMVQSLAGLGILGLCLLRARRAPGLRPLLHDVFQLFACWVILFGPATETCTYIIIAPVIAWCLIDAFSRPMPWGGRLALILSFLMMGPLVMDFVPPAVRNFATEHGSQPLGALLFFSYVLVQMTGASRVCYAERSERQVVPTNAAA